MVFFKRLIILILFCSIFSYAFIGEAKSETDDSSVLISEAEVYLEATFEKILEAEKEDANISDLLNRMNLSANYLAKANVVFRLGDYEAANYFANRSISIINGLQEEVTVLILEAQRLSEIDFTGKLSWSLGGLIIVVSISILFWITIKKQFLNNEKIKFSGVSY